MVTQMWCGVWHPSVVLGLVWIVITTLPPLSQRRVKHWSLEDDVSMVLHTQCARNCWDASLVCVYKHVCSTQAFRYTTLVHPECSLEPVGVNLGFLRASGSALCIVILFKQLIKVLLVYEVTTAQQISTPSGHLGHRSQMQLASGIEATGPQ